VANPSSYKPRTDSSLAESSRKDLVARIARLSSMEDMVITGVELNTSYARVTIFGLPDQPGNCSRVFQAVARRAGWWSI
jgi:aspartate kinase